MILESYLNKVVHADIRKFLNLLPDDCIDLVCTSPPYWSLRDYGEETKAMWGGSEGCEHEWLKEIIKFHEPRHGISSNTMPILSVTKDALGKPPPTNHVCFKCGAWYGQLGLEPTFQLYIDHLVEVFREVKRILKPTGSFYLNIGDTYNVTGAHTKIDKQTQGKNYLSKGGNEQLYRQEKNDPHLPPKSLIGIPWRAFLAMQNDGWIPRNVIVWSKCLSGQTLMFAKVNGRILTEPLKDILRYKYVELPSIEDNQLAWVKLLSYDKRGKCSGIKVVLEDGSEITITKEHRLLTPSGLIEA